MLSTEPGDRHGCTHRKLAVAMAAPLTQGNIVMATPADDWLVNNGDYPGIWING
jgi:hypothetical protein